MKGEPTAYLNGRFVPLSEATLSVADLGVVSGVTLTETLRTFGGRLSFVRPHVERLERGAETLGFPLREPGGAIAEAMCETLERNADLGWADTSLVVVATPGLSQVHSLGRGEGPTLCIHPRPMPGVGFASLYERGRHLKSFVGMHAPTEAYPRDVKHRSRLNWWRASTQCDAGTEPLFVDDDGVVTETSSGNVLVVVRNRILLAPEDRVLPGVTQAVVADVAGAHGYAVERRAFTLENLLDADEVLLSSSNYVLCAVSHVDGVRVSRAKAPGEHFDRLSRAMREQVGFDYVGQAMA